MLAGLRAGAMGVPFLPVRGILGSDHFKVQPRFKVITCPFTGQQVTVVGAINPDFTVIHAFKADKEGNVLAERLSDVDFAVRAADKAIATVEEVVEPGELKEDGRSRLLSWINFYAIVLAPGGAAPTACPGYYDIDRPAMRRYQEMAGGARALPAYEEAEVFGPAKGGG